MTEAIRFAFDVGCAPEHAFDVWAGRIDSWWPRDHTVGPAATVILQPAVGGRIYERDAKGVEHDWGVVTAWDRPARLAYTWHLGGDPEEATDVEIRFLAAGPNTTRVEVEHSGWDRLGDHAGPGRDRNRAGWESLVPHFRTAIERNDE
jgi:uncharacterized protein YndB with AHSA1/START domain